MKAIPEFINKDQESWTEDICNDFDCGELECCDCAIESPKSFYEYLKENEK
jgi:hypothetical protein